MPAINRFFKRKNAPEPVPDPDVEEEIIADAEGNIKEQPKSPMAAIRAKCLDCTCGAHGRIKNCEVLDCPIYHFRMGKNPYRTRTMSDEQRAAAVERLKKARLAKHEKT